MITTSFFELFKIGPGPSSSHTVGPMRAANRFRRNVWKFLQQYQPKVASNITIRVELYGALAATGHGHGTHRAVFAGLLGQEPKLVDIEKLNHYFEEPNKKYAIPFKKQEIPFEEKDIFFDYTPHKYWHPNTLKFVLLNDFQPLFEEIYYSIGGGFIQKEGISIKDENRPKPKYPYSNFAELVAVLEQSDLSIDEFLLENEIALSGLNEKEVLKNIQEIMEVMRKSVEGGLSKEGILPGGLNVYRRAKSMYENAQRMESQKRYADALFARLNAYALATSEENADGQMVVTAPTNGAAGIIPACIEYLRNDCNMPNELLQRGLLVAGMIGYIVKENASISGAELGCQAEVGSAAAMAAALFSFVYGGDIHQISSAAEIAIEHHLGMTCDPIKGLVQVPCIERNANGAIKAYNAYLLASARNSKPIISFDQVVETMRQTGNDLSSKYKETAKGGLAATYGMPGS
ncbi:MAG: L-serine ammonia-lyase [Chitinophagales bacterium]